MARALEARQAGSLYSPPSERVPIYEISDSPDLPKHPAGDPADRHRGGQFAIAGQSCAHNPKASEFCRNAKVHSQGCQRPSAGDPSQPPQAATVRHLRQRVSPPSTSTMRAHAQRNNVRGMRGKRLMGAHPCPSMHGGEHTHQRSRGRESSGSSSLSRSSHHHLLSLPFNPNTTSSSRTRTIQLL